MTIGVDTGSVTVSMMVHTGEGERVPRMKGQTSGMNPVEVEVERFAITYFTETTGYVVAKGRVVGKSGDVTERWGESRADFGVASIRPMVTERWVENAISAHRPEFKRWTI